MPRKKRPASEPTKANREQIIEIARTWKGTPWLHQASLKGEGADCEGFVEGVFKQAGYIEVLGAVRNWRRREDGSLMLALLNEHLDLLPDQSIGAAQPADILAFCDADLRQPDIPRHLGIYTGQRSDGVHYVIHVGNETRGVVEHRMDSRWLRRVHSVWRVRGIDG